MTETYRERCARIDGVIAEAYHQAVKAATWQEMVGESLAQTVSRLADRVEGKRQSFGAKPRFRLDEAIEVAADYVAQAQPWEAREVEQYLDKYSEADALTRYYDAQYDEADAQYEGWSRAFLVPKGHIHSSMHCTSCYPTTEYSWLTDLSGADEDEIVAYAKEIACTVCFPDAPVEKYAAEAAAAKAATECPGSRTHNHDSAGTEYYSRWAHCNVCGQSISVTSTGKLRAHKPKKEAS